MTSEENSKRIREALAAELKRSFGRVGEIHAALSRSQGCLNKFCRAENSLSVDVLLQSLELMEVEAGLFFANALGVSVPRERALERLEVGGRVLAGLPKMERAARRIESSQWPSEARRSEPERLDVERQLAGVTACDVKEQRRRLRTARKYRTAGFARAYLQHLDALRYDRPRVAASSAQALAVHLVPRLRCGRREALALELEAIGVYASARRMTGDFATAARGLLFAIGMARKHRLDRVTPDLLLRASCLLRDHGFLVEALDVLNETLAFHIEADSPLGLGMVLVDRGIIRHYQGRNLEAIRSLNRGLDLIDDPSRSAQRNRLAAYQVLGLAYQSLGQFDRAEAALGQAIAEFKAAGSINWAKLVWQQGEIAYQKESFSAAEEGFRQALELFEESESLESVMVALDLTKALLAQKKLVEAIELAVGMVRYLTSFRKNRVLEGAIQRYVQAALAGRVSMKRIDDLRDKIEAESVTVRGARYGRAQGLSSLSP